MAAKYFVPDDNPCVEEMTCSICLNVWIDPVEVKPCSHTYCADCLGTLSSCPDCRSPITTKSKPNRIISNLLYVLSGRCSRCGWRGTHGEFSTHHNREICSSAGLVAGGDAPKGTTASDALSASSPHTLVEAAAERGDFAVVTEDGRLTCMLFPALPDPSVDGPLSLSTGLETREGSTTVMISTSSKPWRAYGLSKEVYDVLVLAFFAFAEQVPATLAPFPEMASDDRDTASDSVVDLSKRTILLLRPEAVKRCLWWLNAHGIDHDRIVDELFPSFGLSLPQAPDEAQSVNDKPLPRPREGLLASRLAGASDSVVYGVTQHQYLSWLGWNASRLVPPLTEYGLFSHHYEELLNYARTEDADQTGAFEPAAVERIIKKLVEVRSGGPSPSPVSIRSERVLEVLMQRRAAATRDAANRPSSKLILVGPSYPPGEFLLHDVLLACRSVQVDEAWCEVSKEDVGASPTDPRGANIAASAPIMSTNSAGNSVSTAAFHSEGAGKVDPRPTASHSSSTSSANFMVPAAAATPPPKMGLFQRLFGKEKKPQPQPPAAPQSSANLSSAQYPSLGPQRQPQQQQAMGTSTPQQQQSQQSRPSASSASSSSSYPAQASGNSIHSQQQAQLSVQQQQQQQQQYRPPPPGTAYAQQQPQQNAAYRLPAFANIATNTNTNPNNIFPYNASTTSRPPPQNPQPNNVNFPNNYNQQQQQPQYYRQPPQQQQQLYYQQQAPPPQVHPQQQQPYGAYGSQPPQQAAYYGQQPQQPPAGYGYGVPPPPRQPNYPTPYGQQQQQQGTYPNYGVNYQNYQRRF